MGRSMKKGEYDAMARFRHHLRKFLRFSEDVAQEHGVTPLQYQLMLQIKGFPGRSHASNTELADRLQTKHHCVVALVSRCEELDLVRRRASDRDLRSVEVHLTAAGERLVEELAMLHRDELHDLRRLLHGLEGDNTELATA